LERSFNEIFIAEGFENITPARVAEGAEVGRSTFYEHFGGREDLLEKRLLEVLVPLADAAHSDGVPPKLVTTLDHFWAERTIVRSLLTGRPREVTMRALTELIQERLPVQRTPLAVPSRLIAAQTAGGYLALLEEWLSGRYRCASVDLAAFLARGRQRLP
jgi:AcrR family transcriptional regulator